jgi:hypothetical protein
MLKPLVERHTASLDKRYIVPKQPKRSRINKPMSKIHLKQVTNMTMLKSSTSMIVVERFK